MGVSGNISNWVITILNYLLMLLHMIHDYGADRDEDQIKHETHSHHHSQHIPQQPTTQGHKHHTTHSTSLRICKTEPHTTTGHRGNGAHAG